MRSCPLPSLLSIIRLYKYAIRPIGCLNYMPCKSMQTYSLRWNFQDFIISDCYKNIKISINGLHRNFPAQNCKNVVKYSSMKETDIICKCGNDFSFKCLKKAHRPISCHMLADWYDKIGLEECELWIKLNTKPCPKCKVPIEKNKACMHMTCT
jgi:hypothetical protein